jgi:hypothetical protein
MSPKEAVESLILQKKSESAEEEVYKSIKLQKHFDFSNEEGIQSSSSSQLAEPIFDMEESIITEANRSSLFLQNQKKKVESEENSLVKFCSENN